VWKYERFWSDALHENWRRWWTSCKRSSDVARYGIPFFYHVYYLHTYFPTFLCPHSPFLFPKPHDTTHSFPFMMFLIHTDLSSWSAIQSNFTFSSLEMYFAFEQMYFESEKLNIKYKRPRFRSFVKRSCIFYEDLINKFMCPVLIQTILLVEEVCFQNLWRTIQKNMS